MKNTIHRMAAYTALILISALPFSPDVYADSERDKNELSAAISAENDLILAKRRLLEEEEE